jgi:UDP-GlcNAc:undecaprenyl-phosphate GlcNAc-1-phosphate transferase
VWILVFLQAEDTPAFPYKTYVFLFLCGFLATFVLTPVIRTLVVRLKLIDMPDIRKIHRRPVPLLGGLAIYFPFVVLVGSCFLLRNLIGIKLLEEIDSVIALLACGTMALMLGIYDDVQGANARKKLPVQTATAIVAFVLGFRVQGVSLGPLGSINLGVLGPPLTVLWIVGITNAINIIDGLDGLAAGVTLFVCIGNFFVSLFLGKVVMSVVSAILAGALLAFLRYNFPPAKIFLGDTGSLFLGMVVALLSVMSAQKSATMVMMLIPMAVLGLPILDTTLAIFRRSFLGRPIFVSDKGHIHHALLRLGLSPVKVVLILYGFCLFLLGFGAVVLLEKSTAAAIYLGAVGLVAIIGMWILGYLKYENIRTALSRRLRYRINDAFCRLVLLKMKRAPTVEQVWNCLVESGQEFELNRMELSVRGGDKGAARRWVNAKDGSGENGPQAGEWQSRRFDFAGGLGSLVMGYYRSADEDFEVERDYRLGVISQAAERKVAELLSPAGRWGGGRAPEPVG